MSLETRWMLLAEDGRHAWLGRASDPSDAEVEEAGAALDRQGIAGWLAVCRGDYWQAAREPELFVSRRVTAKAGDEGRAVEMWRWLRKSKLAEAGGAAP